MKGLALYVLGLPRLEIDGQPVTVERRKAVALLIYLALSGRPVSRDILATLLWPGYDQATARGNLRRTLSALNATVGEGRLEIERELVTLPMVDGVWVDVVQFSRLLTEREAHAHPVEELCDRCLVSLNAAVTLYRDDFMTGFSMSDAPEFEVWQRTIGERLRMDLASALGLLADGLVRRGEFVAALTAARRRVALDELDEGAQRSLIQLLAWSGDRGTALRQYEAVVGLLRRELQAEPAPETVALGQAIRENRLARPMGNSPGDPDKPASEVPGSAFQSIGMSGSSTPSHAPDHSRDAGPALTAPARDATIGSQTSLLADESTAGSTGGEMRLVSVVSVGPADDVAAEELPELLGRLAAVLEKAVQPYGGYVERLLGANVLAVLGASRSHEDDAERAVGAAQAICAEMGSHLGIGIGVARGEAYFGVAGGGPVTTLGTLIGRAVRLQAAAEPGQTLVDQVTYRETRGAYAYTLIGRQAYAAGNAAIQPYKVRGIEGLTTTLVGRARELDLLREALVQSAAGDGQWVALIGEAGLGKSRLVAELRAAIEQPHGEDVLWLVGRCREMTTGTPYGPFADLVRGYLVREGRLAGGAGLRLALEALAARGRLTVSQVAELGPLLGNLLGLRFGDEWDEVLRYADPGQVRHRTWAALELLLSALASTQPLLVILEDLHWADDLSLDLIGSLSGLLTGRRMLLLVTYRPGAEYPSERLAPLARRRAGARYHEVRLQPLTRVEGGALLDVLLAAVELEGAVKEQILSRAEGNPFYVEELVRSLIDAGALQRVGSTWRAKEPTGEVKVPEGIRSVILSRMDRLPTAERTLLQRAAVLGPQCRRRLLDRLAPPGLDVQDALETLATRAFIYRERTWPEEEYAFEHVLLQETVYATLTAAQRGQLHRQAAEAIELLAADQLSEYYTELAYHYDHGSDTVDGGAKACEYLVLAGQGARRAGLHDEAAVCYRRVLARTGGEESGGEGIAGKLAVMRLAALVGLGETYHLAGQPVEAEEWFRRAVALGGQGAASDDDLARLYWWLHDVLWWQHREADVADLVAEGWARWGSGRSLGNALMLMAITNAVYQQGRTGYPCAYVELSTYLQQLPYCEELRNPYTQIAMHIAEWRHRDADEANAWYDALENHGRHRHELRALTTADTGRARIRQRVGDLAGAIAALEHGINLCTQMGDRLSGILIWHSLSRYRLQLGDLSGAEAAALQGLNLCEQGQISGLFHLSQIMALSNVRLCLREGDPAGDAQQVQERLDGLPAYSRYRPLEWLGWINLALGRRSEACAWFQRALDEAIPGPVFMPPEPNMIEAPIVRILAGYESAVDDLEAFHAACRLRQSAPLPVVVLPAGVEWCDPLRSQPFPIAAPSGLTWWYLEPSVPRPPGTVVEVSDGTDTTAGQLFVGPHWEWITPAGGCSYDPTRGVLFAPNGYDLFFLNQRAPRWLRPATGDIVVEAVCSAGAADRPVGGGLLLWLDRDNYLLLAWGRSVPNEVRFEGCLAGLDAILGRGRLPGERVWLRLERVGGRVLALCSVDGVTWWTAGSAEFPAASPVQVGVCALGLIDRLANPGAFPHGTALRCEAFRLWALR